jgi:hypothetical protein
MTMLQDLADLRRQLADMHVLSVYVDAAENDPTERFSWRKRLSAQLDRIDQNFVDKTGESFNSARRHLEEELRTYSGFLPGRGWAAFVTADRVWHVGEVPAPMPDLVRWRRGPVLGPYLRALKQNRPVVLALVDQRRARLLRYHDGTLSEYADYRADGYIDDLTDRNTSKRATAHSGIRGETGTDAADRILRQETDRLVKQVAKDLRPDGDGFVILAGSTPAVAALQKLIEPAGGERLIVEPALHLAMSIAELQPKVEAAASALTGRLQLARVAAVVDDAGPGGSGAIGSEALADACARGQVERLLVTTAFVTDHEDVAEELIGQTLDHGGVVELVGDEAAALLHSTGDGAAARLRYATKDVAVGMNA